MNSEQPLATPRMTPPSAGYQFEKADDEDQYYDDHSVLGSSEESNVESEESEDDSDEGDEEHQNKDKEQENEDIETSIPESAGTYAQPEAEPSLSMCMDYSEALETGETSKHTPATENLDTNQKDAPSLNHAPAPSLQSTASKPQSPTTGLTTFSSQPERPFNRTSEPIPLTPLCSFSRYGEQPSLQPGETLPERSVDSRLALPPIMQTWQPPRYPLASPPLPSGYPRYNDGPFATNQSLPGAGAPGEDCNSSKLSDSAPFLDPMSPMMPRTSCDKPKNSAPSRRSSPTILPLSIETMPVDLRKRKAAEMDSESENDHQVPHSNSALSPAEYRESANENRGPPDQPTSISAILNVSPNSQLTAVSVSESPKEAKESERPSKKAKTSHQGSFGSHAATAFVAAMVGAVGTVAALASLPPDFFA